MCGEFVGDFQTGLKRGNIVLLKVQKAFPSAIAFYFGTCYYFNEEIKIVRFCGNCKVYITCKTARFSTKERNGKKT